MIAKKGSWAESREMFRKALGGWNEDQPQTIRETSK